MHEILPKNMILQKKVLLRKVDSESSTMHSERDLFQGNRFFTDRGHSKTTWTKVGG
jgi:hypothetical protein